MIGDFISDQEFTCIADFFKAESGIHLRDHKKNLVCGRLNQRLRILGLSSYGEYIEYLKIPNNKGERNMCIDLLTTNETYFFRERKHFEKLAELFTTYYQKSAPNIWCAACSSGEEAYTLAMCTQEHYGHGNWVVRASDISERMLNLAKKAIYPLHRAKNIPDEYLRKYCLNGVGEKTGYIMVNDELYHKVNFFKNNLLVPNIGGKADIIFLRNALIYFEKDEKVKILENIYRAMPKQGFLFLGHSESLNGVYDKFESIAPAVYAKC
ncbi:CheR family methyltransferase [Pseudoalteromonas sp. Of11M-6]|uniref:CheR family methyltransferase n=1 Tax=Pseudoalteromonas sp. Of11M-6 TaxID=2917754 RepID=UPI001EF5478A|nr:CheR family methyltransferase [Pseudoalteromonas sp. Of11M-6]MCG7553868.1 methylase [Pseudoalteromonas sp. Of11M-6]